MEKKSKRVKRSCAQCRTEKRRQKFRRGGGAKSPVVRIAVVVEVVRAQATVIIDIERTGARPTHYYPNPSSSQHRSVHRIRS